MKFKKLTMAAVLALGISAFTINNVMAACPCNQEMPTVTGGACPCENQLNDSCDKCPAPTSAACPVTAMPQRQDMKQIYAYPNAVYGTNNYIGEQAASITSSENAYPLTAGLNPNISGVTVSSEGQITGAATQMPCLNEALSRHNGIPIVRDESKMDNNSCPINIDTANSLQAIKKSFVPFELNDSGITGAASGLNPMNMFPDVPSGHWAACDIDKLAMNDVIVGYPDRTFKPSRNISRAEFATMLVKGLDTDDYSCSKNQLFSDVPRHHWANSAISQAVNQNLLKGYPNGLFKPANPVTRAEALCAVSKKITCDIDACKAKEILSKYHDGNSVPEWAQIPVAKALQQGALNNSPNPEMIYPFKDATRADVASMLQTIRVASGIDKNPVTANNSCPITPDDKQAYIENEEIVSIPTLKLEFLDQVNSKFAHVGQRFAAKTLEDVTIDGCSYPCGSKVYGKVVEVIRPSGCQKGALKLAFTEIEHCGNKTKLPAQILTAQINKSNTPNILARTIAMPFRWAGSLVGVVGRTTGGMISNLGNAVENVSNGAGTTLSEVFQGQFMAAGRSLADAGMETIKAPVDFTRTALSGSMGLLQTTGDEVAYVVDAKGYKLSSVNPKEHITIAFGCGK